MAAGAMPDQPGFSLPVGTVTFLLTDVEDSTRQWETRAGADGRRDRPPLRVARRGDRRAQRRATGRAGRGRQRGRRVRPGLRRARRGRRRAAPPARRAVAGRHGPWRCGWRSTPARPSSATKATTSDRRSSGARGCGRSAPAARSWCRVRPPTSSATGCPAGVSLVDLGLHRLKDLGRPEHVFELRHPDIPPATRRCARSTTCRTTCRCS